MVQLNPFKWGSEQRQKKKKEKLKVESLKKTLSSRTIGRSASNKKVKARKELNKMGHLTDKQKADKDKKDRRAYDKEHLKYNKRGRLIGTKEGYDPSKGVQKKTTKKTATKSSSKPKKKMSRLEAENRKRFGDAHVDKLIARQKAFRNRNKK